MLTKKIVTNFVCDAAVIFLIYLCCFSIMHLHNTLIFCILMSWTWWYRMNVCTGISKHVNVPLRKLHIYCFNAITFDFYNLDNKVVDIIIVNTTTFFSGKSIFM